MRDIVKHIKLSTQEANAKDHLIVKLVVKDVREWMQEVLNLIIKMVHKIFVDGSGYNGINSAYCVIVNYGEILSKKFTKVFDEKIYVPEIEYIAIIAGLELAKKDSIIYSDREDVVDGLNLKRKPLNFELFKKARELMEEKNIIIVHISREKNVAGFELSKRLNKLHQYKEEVMNPKINPKIKKDRMRRRYS